MKVEIGEYLRLDNGCICKVLKYTDISDDDFYVNTDSQYNVVYKSWIIKSSPNIIDLIEVGDYINGKKVTKTNLDKTMNGETAILCGDSNYDCLDVIYKNCDIKSIVTKECFESMEYKVGEQ